MELRETGAQVRRFPSIPRLAAAGTAVYTYAMKRRLLTFIFGILIPLALFVLMAWYAIQVMGIGR